MSRWVVIGGVLAVLGLALWVWGALHYVYSTGERAGFVQKFSKRGWIFKTWEGELAMVNLPGAMPEIFYFTVRDEKVIPSIENTMGNRVVLTYNQHRGLPPRILGDTPYFVNKVRVVVDGGGPPPPVADASQH
ncbi:MAG: hypothetical protein IPN90_03150 [Elusimicrobia bacterium]|nr:hypothetical protein [Elusimicrobiota bacterium]